MLVRSASLETAVEVLSRDGLVAFPTETVWGLAALAFSSAAVERLQRWKTRDRDRPISILVDRPERLPELGLELPPRARNLAMALWPGPLTLILPASGERDLPAGIAGVGGGVGVRCSPHPVALALAEATLEQGLGPVTATSLNRSGEAPAGDRGEAIRLLEASREAGAKVDLLDLPRLLQMGDRDAGRSEPSTVLDLSGAEPRVLRWGAVRAARLEPLLADLVG